MTEIDDIKKKIEELKVQAAELHYDRNRQMQIMCNDRIKQNLVKSKKRWISTNVFFIHYVLLFGTFALYTVLVLTGIFENLTNIIWYFWLLMCLMVCKSVVSHLIYKHNRGL